METQIGSMAVSSGMVRQEAWIRIRSVCTTTTGQAQPQVTMVETGSAQRRSFFAQQVPSPHFQIPVGKSWIPMGRWLPNSILNAIHNHQLIRALSTPFQALFHALVSKWVSTAQQVNCASTRQRLDGIRLPDMTLEWTITLGIQSRRTSLGQRCT